MHNYQEIFTFQHLYQAYKMCLKGKRHKQEAIDFSLALSPSLWSLYYELIYHTYQVSGYHEFKIFDPKERMIQAISFRDRVVQHCIVDNYLIPLFTKRFIYDNVACQIDKGTSLAHKRIRVFLCQYFKKHGKKGYVVKLDIHKYFESIDHDVLKALLTKMVPDQQALRLLFVIIDSYNFQSNKGLPMGNQTSQYFALLYLNSLDHFIKEKLQVKYYLRYMDDMLLLVNSKQKASECYRQIKEVIESKKLSLNPKSRYFPLKDGFEMIGWRFRLLDTGKIIATLRRSSKNRIKGRVKAEILKASNFQQIHQMKVAYKGFLQYGNAYSFYQRLWIKMSKIDYAFYL